MVSSASATTASSATDTENRNWHAAANCWACQPVNPPALEATQDYRDRYEELTGNSLRECPACHQGRMVIVAILPPGLHCQHGNHRYLMRFPRISHIDRAAAIKLAGPSHGTSVAIRLMRAISRLRNCRDPIPRRAPLGCHGEHCAATFRSRSSLSDTNANSGGQSKHIESGVSAAV